MHKLSFENQIDVLLEFAGTRQIEPDDCYLRVYPDLLKGIQNSVPLDRSKLMLVANAIFGWMPTALRVTMHKLDDALLILSRGRAIFIL